MSYLLDANACIRVLNGTSKALVTRLRRENPSGIRMCSVVKAELHFGARKSAHPAKNLALLSKFWKPFASVSFDDQAAEHYGLIRADLSREGRLIGPNDLLIAAAARAHDLTLVTHNTDEFGRVVGLRVEDWEE